MSRPSVRDYPVTVLLIDDQAMIGEAVRRMLADDRDIAFHYCQDPTAALDFAYDVAPTVILADLVMPEIDGLLLVRFLRANPATADVPIIVLSGREDPLVKAEAFARGANDYVVKLPDRLELIARIRYHSWGYINHRQRDEAYAKLEQQNSRLRRMSNVIQAQKGEIERQKKFIQQLFGRYLSDEIVDTLIQAPAGVALAGEKRRVTVLMSDLRGFTTACQALDPTHVVALLNIYLGRMADIIMRHRGTIDEFIGDAILAIFGAPILREDDAHRAVSCALEMQRAMAAVNEELTAKDLPPVEMGIALNTGEVVVGNIGSEQRAKYGVVGSPVNLTARIEAQTTGGQVLVSESTIEAVGRATLVLGEAYEIAAKGFAERLKASELRGRADDPAGLLPARNAGLRDLVGARDVRLARVDKESKSLGAERLIGRVRALSASGALIECDEPIAERADLCVWLGDGAKGEGEVYAKVVARRRDGALELRFTAVPKSARGMIEKMLGSEEKA